MKRNRLFLLSVLLPALSTMQAQTSYEAAALLNTDLSGTARYVGMGGAMSALGADMSSMATNPAGVNEIITSRMIVTVFVGAYICGAVETFNIINSPISFCLIHI